MTAGASCDSCPSFLANDEAVRVRFGKPTGSQMCGRYGHVLGRPGQANEQVLQHFAMNCDAFGQPPTSTPVRIEPKVTTLDEKIVSAGGTGQTVPTCNGCENLVPAGVVATDFGWAAPICKAKGILVLRPLSECRGCPWAKPGYPARDTTGLHLREEYMPGFFIPVEVAVQALVSLGNTQVEPSQYPTDKPLDDEDRADGIRAWRRVQDPNGSGNVTYLPIFDPSKFTPAQRALIPQTGDIEHPELYVDYSGLLYTFAVEVPVLDEALALLGPPGVGKTEFARWAAWLMQVPFRRFSFSGSTEVEDMIGKWVFEGGETVFHEGRIPLAWVETGVLVFDEPNTAPEDVSQVIRPLIDNSKQLVLDAAKGETRQRDPYCFFLMAMNDSYDHRNTGTRDLAAADASRLSYIHVDNPPEAVERHIITERCRVLDDYEIPAETLTAIMRIAEDIREMSEQGTFPGTWGVREQIKVSRKTRWYNLVDAYKRASLDLYEPATAALVIRAIQTVTGEIQPETKSDLPDEEAF